MSGLAVNYLALRHGTPARWLRAGMSRWLAGRKAWPLVFRAPTIDCVVPQGATSPNLYVHLPFCRQICPHCPYNRILLDPNLVAAYGRALERELKVYLERPGLPPVETLYFGGGTPSQTPELIEQVMTMMRSRLATGAEVGVEVHPADASPALLSRLQESGVNRISFGIETLRPDLLRLLARRYTPEKALEAVRAAGAMGLSCVDVNLIHGIPGQRMEDAVTDAERCVALGVDQISAYPLFGFAHTPLGRDGRFRPSGERERLRAQKAVSRVCREGGLQRTSVWSFTRTDLSPYSTVTHEDYLGFGAGAGSKVAGVFWFNTFSVREYASCSVARPALIMQAGERLRRFTGSTGRSTVRASNPPATRSCLVAALRTISGCCWAL
jgi:coproporphyrinogen III oxidase-like Fe-S oxidoreductase